MADDFNSVGFIGQEIDVMMESHLKERTAWYELVHRLTVFANEIRHSFVINQDDPRRVVAAALFIKAITSFQAIILLSKKGLGVDAAVITRSLMEVVFPLKILSNEEGFVYEFILTEKVKRMKLLNVILRDKDTFSTISDGMNEEQVDQLKQEIAHENIRDFSVDELSKRAGMKAFYQLAYRHISDDVHTTIWSLKKYLTTDQEGNIVELDDGEQIFELENFKTAALCILIALDSVNDIFQIGFQNQIEEFQQKILHYKELNT
jgi:hypothetical protein